MNISFDFASPERVTVGTVGPPGQRTFFVQAREGQQLATLKVEKEQVRQLADYLSTILEDVAAPTALPGGLDLETPIEQDWIVGTIRVAPFDEEHDRIHILFEELVPEPEAGTEAAPGATARVALSRPQLVAFVQRATALVNAGRETCILCGNPKDPAGHACPRSNGHGG